MGIAARYIYLQVGWVNMLKLSVLTEDTKNPLKVANKVLILNRHASPFGFWHYDPLIILITNTPVAEMMGAQKRKEKGMLSFNFTILLTSLFLS
jgi:hypothetical protein